MKVLNPVVPFHLVILMQKGYESTSPNHVQRSLQNNDMLMQARAQRAAARAQWPVGCVVSGHAKPWRHSAGDGRHRRPRQPGGALAADCRPVQVIRASSSALCAQDPSCSWRLECSEVVLASLHVQSATAGMRWGVLAIRARNCLLLPFMEGAMLQIVISHVCLAAAG
jgi:hypothetical protein